jgi:predicted nuclease with TOPRIM domain
MEKPTKYDMSDNDACESDDCWSDDDEEEYTKVELMDMLEQVHTCFEMKRKECKELRKVKSLEQSFDELNASHENLREDHEELDKAHTKLEKAYSSLLEQVKKEQVIVSYDVGLTYDILDESFYKPLLLLPLTLLVALLLPLHL